MAQVPLSATYLRTGTRRIASTPYVMAKRLTDLALSVPALILSLPVLMLCALLVKVRSRGPIIFTQTRCGQGDTIFRMYKMRTMRQDAETGTGAVWAQDDDPRVVRGCRWMRRSHIDELPQLVNVILGQMSLVGPRPERPEIAFNLEAAHPELRRRQEALPGITGLAQIRCGYDTTTERFRDKLDADLEYIEKRNWLFDMKIIFSTVPMFCDRKSK